MWQLKYLFIFTPKNWGICSFRLIFFNPVETTNRTKSLKQLWSWRFVLLGCWRLSFFSTTAYRFGQEHFVEIRANTQRLQEIGEPRSTSRKNDIPPWKWLKCLDLLHWWTPKLDSSHGKKDSKSWVWKIYDLITYEYIAFNSWNLEITTWNVSIKPYRCGQTLVHRFDRNGMPALNSKTLHFTDLTGESHSEVNLGGGFKHFLFSPLLREDSHFGRIFFRWVETTNKWIIWQTITASEYPPIQTTSTRYVRVWDNAA